MLYFWCISYHWRVCCWLVTTVRTDTRQYRKRIVLKFTHINSSAPWLSATKKCWLSFTLCEIRPTFDEKYGAKDTSTADRDTPHRSASEAEQHKDGDYMSYLLEVIIESHLLWKIILNLTEQMLFVYFCLFPHIKGHKAGLFHAHWFPVVFCSRQDLTFAGAVLAFPFTFENVVSFFYAVT